MASTVVPFRSAPLSPCSTGRSGWAWMPSASAVRRARCAACSALVGVVHLEADDLAAVEVEDQVQVEPASLHLGRQERHVPAPDLARARSPHVRAGRARRPWRAGPAAAAASGRGRAARDGSWPRWRCRRPRRPAPGRSEPAACSAKRGSLATSTMRARSASLRACDGRGRAAVGPAVGLHLAIAGTPALEGAGVDAGQSTGRGQPGTGGAGRR